MKLVLISNSGEVLDTSDDFTAEELANLSPAGALALVGELSPGSAS